jgi:HlyD family secretion protein
MDIARPEFRRKRLIRRSIIGSIVGLLILGASVGVSRLKPADPAVERSMIVIDSVKRGLMLREVRGTGTFVPEEILWITAAADGLVVNVPLQPGVEVNDQTLLLELINPELVLAASKAEWAAKSAEAQLASLAASQQTELLETKAASARQSAEHHQAELQLKVDEQLFKDDLISQRQLDLDRAKVDNLANLIEISKLQVEFKSRSQAAELAVQQASVEQACAEFELKKRLLDALKIRAGIGGVLEQVKVEVGQRVSSGTVLAKVTNPRRLKAALKIPETQARDVILGQKATVDTRSSLLKGHVIRINPASEAGSVTVDVAIDSTLPREARPDASVDGTIELERLEDVLYVGRPVYAQQDASVSLFKLDNLGAAVRARARFGRSSVNTIEVLEGLELGDQVILSDTKEWDAYERLRIQ